MHPQRPRLRDQLVRELQEGIRSGHWGQWLPPERLLAEELRTSRSSLRQALGQLKGQGILEARRGEGTRILDPELPSLPALTPPIVTLLTPGSLDFRRPVRSISVDYLREQLSAAGCRLNIGESRAAYSRSPQKALAEWVARHPSSCWVLRLSSRAMQKWFQDQGLPTVILGTAHAGIQLPFVDVDRRALYRHAAGTLIAAGHRRIALVISRTSQGGDVASERGFAEAFEPSAPEKASGEILRHEESVTGLVRELKLRFRRAAPPTALLIAQPTYYLTAFSWLLRNGYQVPRDVSLMTQIHEPHLAYLIPQPACYEISSIAFTRKLLLAVTACLKGSPRSPQKNWIMPKYQPGGSIGNLKC